MRALTSADVQRIWAAVDSVPADEVEKRELFISRIQAWVRIYGAADLDRAIQSALIGLKP